MLKFYREDPTDWKKAWHKLQDKWEYTDICGAGIDYNIDAKQIALDGAADGTVVVANCQTAGRGRMDRSFQSPRDKGIYLTVLLRPDLPTERLIPVTALAGVAVCEAVEQVCGVRPGLKWPNDPVLGNKKLCGILTEMSLAALRQ